MKTFIICIEGLFNAVFQEHPSSEWKVDLTHLGEFREESFFDDIHSFCIVPYIPPVQLDHYILQI